MHVSSLGLSPKLLAPILTALAAVVASWITTGVLDRAELAVLATTAIGAVAAYLAPVGEIAIPDLEALPYDPDQALDDDDLAGPAPTTGLKAGVDNPDS